MNLFKFSIVLIFSLVGFFSYETPVHAANFNSDPNDLISVYEKNIAEWVTTGRVPGYGIFAEIKGTSVNKKFLCPTGGCDAIEVNLDVYQLMRDTPYTLRICDLDDKGNIDPGYDCPEKAFRTVATDTRVSGGEWWYSTSFDINAYPQTDATAAFGTISSKASFGQFATEKECKESQARYMFRILKDATPNSTGRTTIQFTDCFNKKPINGAPPAKTEFTSRLKSFEEQFKKVSIAPYFYRYRRNSDSGTDLFYYAGPFESSKECEDHAKAMTDIEIIQPCYTSLEIPKENTISGSVTGQGFGTWFFNSVVTSTPLPEKGAATKEACDVARTNHIAEVKKQPAYASLTDIAGECYEAGSNPYNLLAPFPGIGRIDETVTFSDYVNRIIRIAIGVAIVFAIVVLVYSGVQMALVDSVGQKTDAKKNIENVFWSLGFILLSYLILNTINPRLVNNTVSVPIANIEMISIEAPDGGDIDEPIRVAINCGPNSLSPNTSTGYCMFGTPETPKPTGDIPQMVELLKQGYEITKIQIFTDNKRIYFTTKKGADEKKFATSVVGFGANGISERGAGVSGDKKTPKGDLSIQYVQVSKDQSKRIVNKKGQSMGGVVMMLNVGSRGIAIHGNTKNAPGKSAGCVIMYNDDLMALAPYIKNNTPVWIGTL